MKEDGNIRPVLSQGLSEEGFGDMRWEIVYFLHPECGGTCAHCWSAQTLLGRAMPLRWHKGFWKHVDSRKVKEVRLSGGDPFFYKDIGNVVRVIREEIGVEIPILIFTSGRNIISRLSGQEGMEETVRKIIGTGVVFDNVEIHLSADEHHAGSLYRSEKGIRSRPASQREVERMNELGIHLLQTQVRNFLAACDILTANNVGFKGGKLKIHAETGRLEYHRQKIFPWIEDERWEKQALSSEGLIKAGAASDCESAMELLPSPQLSLFIFPGAEFLKAPRTGRAQAYRTLDDRETIYLDIADPEGHGASIVGWWNIINRIFCGGSAYDAYDLIGKKDI